MSITSIVHEDIDMAVDCDGLFGNSVEFVQRRGDIKFKDSCTLVLEIIKLCEGSSTTCCDDLVTSLQRSDGEITAQSRSTGCEDDYKIDEGKFAYEVPVMSQTSCLDIMMVRRC